jgi:hypothetical protein
VKLALGYARKHPRNFLMLKYEDLVAEPAAALARVFAFVKLEFDHSYLDIPHVNHAETPYNLDSQTRGINSSRLYYYGEIVSPRHDRLLRAFIQKQVLKKTYPEFVEAAPRWAPDVSWVRARGTASMVKQEMRLVVRAPAKAISRVWHRI